MVLSNVSYLTLRAPCIFLFVFLLGFTQEQWCMWVNANYAMMPQLRLYYPSMCIPIMGYIDAISFNCIFNI